MLRGNLEGHAPSRPRGRWGLDGHRQKHDGRDRSAALRSVVAAGCV